MASLNKVQIIGNCGKDPEIRYMPSGSAVAKVSVATTEKWKDKQTGDSKEKTEWHNLVFFGRLGEIVGEYVHKGSPIYVEGQLRTNKWQDKNGVDRYTTEIVVREMQLLGGKPAGQGGQDRAAGRASKPTPSQQPIDDGFDDDIPFL